jgi:rhodanese-related sulfurtransferase
MAGALGMSWTRFVAYDLGAGLIWTLAFMALGVVFAGQIQIVLDFMTEFGTIAAVAVAIALAVMITYRYLKRRWMLSERYAPRIAVNELRELIRRGEEPIVIDVRSSVATAHDPRRLPGAISATLADLPVTAGGLPRDREIVLYCNCPNEVSALRGVRILADLGLHRSRALVGGLDAWIEIESVSPLGQAASAPIAVVATQGPTSAIVFGSESAT